MVAVVVVGALPPPQQQQPQQPSIADQVCRVGLTLFVMSKFVLRLTRYNKVIWLTLDQNMSGASSPVLDFIEWPGKSPWKTLFFKLEERAWIPRSDVFELVFETKKVFDYLRSHPLSSTNHVKQLEQKFPKVRFQGKWVSESNYSSTSNNWKKLMTVYTKKVS